MSRPCIGWRQRFTAIAVKVGAPDARRTVCPSPKKRMIAIGMNAGLKIAAIARGNTDRAVPWKPRINIKTEHFLALCFSALPSLRNSHSSARELRRA
jgi:hypothetical protein